MAGTVFAASAINVASQDADGFAEIPIVGLILLAGASVALVWRRRWSLLVLAAALVMTIVWMVLGYPGNPVFHILTALYAVGRYTANWTIGLAASAVAVAVVVVGQLADGDPLSDVITAIVLTALPWYVGRLIRNRAAAARERAEYLEWKRAADAQRVIDDARTGIARELHDVVAHNVSVMTVQSGVARLVVRDDPERAVEAIAAVENAGRQALEELRHLLGVLRPEAGGEELEPQPVLGHVAELVDRLRRTGMEVTFDADMRSKLPVRVDLFAYRIVQEALTNVLKHAGVDATAHVSLAEHDGAVEIDITNTGATDNTVRGAGQGIVGMSERAALLGGSFEAGPLPQGGFRVHASLPIGEQ